MISHLVMVIELDDMNYQREYMVSKFFYLSMFYSCYCEGDLILIHWTNINHSRSLLFLFCSDTF